MTLNNYTQTQHTYEPRTQHAFFKNNLVFLVFGFLADYYYY